MCRAQGGCRGKRVGNRWGCSLCVVLFEPVVTTTAAICFTGSPEITKFLLNSKVEPDCSAEPDLPLPYPAIMVDLTQSMRWEYHEGPTIGSYRGER